MYKKIFLILIFAFEVAFCYKTSALKPLGKGGNDINYSSLKITQAPYYITTKILEPTNGVVTSKFGKRVNPITHRKGFHTGIDIANYENTQIYAAFSGKVNKCGSNSVYGNFIEIVHSNNLTTFYAHCNSIKAKEGMYIRAGEIIGYMGSTGYSTGPHLHFEIRINGIRVNPEFVLKGNKDIEF